jgi:hypothetical protein
MNGFTVSGSWFLLFMAHSRIQNDDDEDGSISPPLSPDLHSVTRLLNCSSAKASFCPPADLASRTRHTHFTCQTKGDSNQWSKESGQDPSHPCLSHTCMSFRRNCFCPVAGGSRTRARGLSTAPRLVQTEMVLTLLSTSSTYAYRLRQPATQGRYNRCLNSNNSQNGQDVCV